MTELNIKPPLIYVFIFLGAGILWFLGFILGGLALSSMLTIFTRPEQAVIVWGVIWGICLAAASITSSIHIYEHNTEQ